MTSLFIFLLIPQIALSETRTKLFTKVENEAPPIKNSPAPKLFEEKSNIKSPIYKETGNLPRYLRISSNISIEESPVIVPSAKQSIRNPDILIGDVINAEITESLIAFADSKAPIRAIIKNGKLKNSILVGEATLEKNSKRILIEFKKVTTTNSKQTWSLTASALDEKGILGLEGKLISSEDKYFAAEFLAAAASGYADSTVERNQNNQGNYIEKPGTDTYAKKALTSALSKTADRFGEKLKSVPEYAILEGPFNIQVLITEEPKLNQ